MLQQLVFFFLLVCLPVCLSRPLFLSVCYSETDGLRWAVYQIQQNWILIKYVYFEFCKMYTEMWSHSFETLIWSQNLQAPRKTSKPGRFHRRLYKSRGARPFSRNRMESFSDMMWTIELDQANQTSSLQLIIKPLYKSKTSPVSRGTGLQLERWMLLVSGQRVKKFQTRLQKTVSWRNRYYMNSLWDSVFQSSFFFF